jgi:GNAT superfamily N-acetyltransferase
LIRFAIEKWDDLRRDARDIFPAHFQELALHQEDVTLDIDDSMYHLFEDRGRLLILTARDNGELVGYYVAVLLENHPHNKSFGIVSACDMFYMKKENRKGGAGAKLLIAAAAALKARGVKKATMSTKLHFENRDLMEALGWEATDTVFQRLL